MSSITGISAENVRRRSVQGAAVTVVSQALRFLILFSSQIALVRMLDPAEFGIIAMAAPVLLFVQTINDLGLGQAIVQRPDVTQKQISAMFWVSAAISVVLTLVIMLAAPLFSLLYGEPLVTPITRALGGLVFLTGITIVPAAILNRQMRFVSLAIVDVCSLTAGAAVGIVAALNGYGFWSLVFVQVVTSVISSLLYWIFASWRPSWPASDPELGAFLRFGIHLTGANLATYLSTSVDRVLIGATVGKLALGLYDRSYRLVLQPLTQLMAPVSRVAIPMLSRLNGSDEMFARSYLYMLQFTLIASIPGLLVNIVMARPIVSLIFGTQWSDAAPIFGWICVGGLASSMYSSTSWLFTSQGRTREQMRFNIMTSMINVTSFAIGVFGGAVGVAAVSGVCFVLVQTPLLMWGATRNGAVSARAVLRAVTPFVVAGVLTAAALIVAGQTTGQATLVQVLLAEALSYGVFSLALACQPGGRAFIRSTWGLKSSFARGV